MAASDPLLSTTASDQRSHLAAIAAVVLWATGNVMVRRVPMDGVQIAFWRLLLGGVLYSAVMVGRGQRLTRQQIRALTPAAVVIAIEIALFFVAIKNTTIANATVIGALQPLLVMAVATRRFGETVGRWLLAVAVIAMGGVILVVFGSRTQPTWSPRGDLFAVGAVIFFAAYFLLAKRARETVPAFEMQAASMLIGALVVAPFAIVDAGALEVPTVRSWLWLLALLAVPGTGHLLMNWAHPRVRLSFTSLLTLAIPALSSLGAAMFLGETVAALQVVGMVVVLGALALAIQREASSIPRRAG